MKATTSPETVRSLNVPEVCFLLYEVIILNHQYLDLMAQSHAQLRSYRITIIERESGRVYYEAHHRVYTDPCACVLHIKLGCQYLNS